MSVVFTAVGALLLIQSVIVVHEFGHFLAAKAVGIPVTEFCVGAGPVLFRRTWRGTTYTLRLLPIMGYVLAEMPEQGFHTYALWRRILYILAGPAANLVALVGLGIWLIPEVLEAQGQAGAIPWWSLPVRSAQLAGHLTWQTVLGLIGAVAGHGGVTIGGPVAVYQSSQQAITSGLTHTVLWLYSIHMSLALFNLLPIPPLDGGRLLLCAIEAVRRRPLSPRVELTIIKIGAAAFLALVVVVTVGDFLRW